MAHMFSSRKIANTFFHVFWGMVTGSLMYFFGIKTMSIKIS